MKKFLLSLATVLCATSFASAAEVTYSHTFASSDLKTSGGDVTLSDVSWTSTSATYVGYDTNNGRGIQIGSSKKPNASYSLSTSAFAEYTIKSITVNSSIASGGDATLTVNVGGTDVINAQKVTIQATDYTADNINLTGNVTISWACTTKAYYIKSISITYETSQDVVIVDAPVISLAEGVYGEAQEVTITAAAGNKVYYTLDGTKPTDASNLYEVPITVSATSTVKAIAVDPDDNTSSVATTIIAIAEGAKGDGTEADPYNAIAANAAAFAGILGDNVYVEGIIASVKTIDTGSYGNAEYYISADGTETNQFYIYRGLGLNGAKFTSVDDLKPGMKVVVCGTLVLYQGNSPQLTTGSKIVELETTGVEDIEINENAPVEYYNLQGVRVENPANGLYIMRQGDKVVKVIK